MATKRSALRSARSIRSMPSGISPNQTTCGRNAPARPQSGQTSETVRSSSHGRTASQRPQRAFKSSPCMWMTDAEPARSCRSSMFCVTSVRVSPRSASASSEPRQREMRRVGLGVAQVAPTQIIEREHRFGIAGEGFGRRQLHRVELRPDPLALLVTKRAQPALGRHPAPVRTKMFCGMPCPTARAARARSARWPRSARARSGSRSPLRAASRGRRR